MRGNLGLLSKTSVPEFKFCCSVSSEILCNTYGFNGWLASLPLLNLKSLNLDTLLLQQLCKCTQRDSSETHEVYLLIFSLFLNFVYYLFPEFSARPDNFEC